jgi:hypothetical protein
MAHDHLTHDQRSENAKRRWAKLTPEQRSARGLKSVMAQTPEQRSKNAKHASAGMSHAERSAWMTALNAELTPEERERRRLESIRRFESLSIEQIAKRGRNIAKALTGQIRRPFCPMCRERPKADRRASYCKPCGRKRMIMNSFGLSAQQYDSIYIQGVRCGICGNDNQSRTLELDHQPNSDIVRGPLCTNCNWLMGVVDGINSAQIFDRAWRWKNGENLQIIPANKRKGIRAGGHDRKYRLMRCHGLSSAQYESLLALSITQCGICSGDNGGRPLELDHEPSTDIVRGLLCTRCNRLMGILDNERATQIVDRALRWKNGENLQIMPVNKPAHYNGRALERRAKGIKLTSEERREIAKLAARERQRKRASA